MRLKLILRSLLISTFLSISIIFLSCTDDESSGLDQPENKAPIVVNALADLSLEQGFGATTVDLSGVFSDEDGTTLIYSATVSGVSVITASVTNTNLTINEVGKGNAIVTITATDENEASSSSSFAVTVDAQSLFSSELTAIFSEECEKGLNPDNAGDNIFVERDSFLIMEAEDAYYAGNEGNWTFKTDTTGYSGTGYYQWSNPEAIWNGGLIKRSSQLWFNIYISKPGTYIVGVRGKINQGNSDSEHNDVWLKINGADDFYAYRNKAGADRFRRPEDIADSNTPGEPIAADRGYMKAYNKTLGRWSYETRNVDFEEYNIFARFDEPGIYSVILAGKVTGFAVDQVVLIGDPSWQNYSRLANKVAILNETADKAAYNCEK
ncbi:MAG: hypothetical protein AAGB24_14930 [Bacteroidota bacterium]